MEVFLSYPSERLKIAREVYDFLKSVDVDAWFDKTSLVAGQDWDRERTEAQRRADLTVLICSRETVERAGVIQREVQDILDLLKAKPIGQIYLVSVRTDDIRLPPELAKYHYVNHFEQDWKLQLGRSIELKFKQAEADIPDKLVKFFQGNQFPEIYTVKSFRESTNLLEAETEFFTYNLEGDYWIYVNSTIISIIFGGLYRAKFDFCETVEWSSQKNSWQIRAEEFFRSGEVLSIRLITYWFASGAAHPNYRFSSFNIAGPDVGKFDLRELFSYDLETLKYLRKYCELDIRRQLLVVEEEVEFFFPNTDDATWQTLSQFNFDKSGLVINF